MPELLDLYSFVAISYNQLLHYWLLDLPSPARGYHPVLSVTIGYHPVLSVKHLVVAHLAARLTLNPNPYTLTPNP